MLFRSSRCHDLRVGADAQIVTTAEQVDAASKVVLPGVGAFRDAIAHLREQGLVDAIKRSIDDGKPFLGICLGLQLLFDVSYEDGDYAGLGVVPGDVVRFDFEGKPEAKEQKIPHMGWNQLRWDRDCPLLTGIEQDTHFYFVHSYYVRPKDEAVTCGKANYGGDFTAMIWRDNLYATQFHPEKSQAEGLKLLANFAKL